MNPLDRFTFLDVKVIFFEYKKMEDLVKNIIQITLIRTRGQKDYEVLKKYIYTYEKNIYTYEKYIYIIINPLARIIVLQRYGTIIK